MRGVLTFFPSVLKIIENFQTYRFPHFGHNASDSSSESLLPGKTGVELFHTKGEYKSVYRCDSMLIYAWERAGHKYLFAFIK